MSGGVTLKPVQGWDYWRVSRIGENDASAAAWNFDSIRQL
jgi:hypothetical protein